MSGLPGGQFSIQQIDGMVVLYNQYNEEVIVRFDPKDANAAAQAQGDIYACPLLDDEQKSLAHFWSGYFYGRAVG